MAIRQWECECGQVNGGNICFKCHKMRPGTNASGLRRCSKCGWRINSDDKFCNKCGAATTINIKCPSCGCETSGNVERCSHCNISIKDLFFEQNLTDDLEAFAADCESQQLTQNVLDKAKQNSMIALIIISIMESVAKQEDEMLVCESTASDSFKWLTTYAKESSEKAGMQYVRC